MDEVDRVEATDGVAQVRRVLRANAAVTGPCGALLLVVGNPLAEALDVERVVVTAIAVFFLLLAVDVGILAGRCSDTVVTTARLLAVADGGWTIGTVVIVAAGVLPVRGALLALAVAAVTGGFAVAEHRAAGAARPATALAT